MKEASLELGVIGNGSIAALLDEQARVVWCCLPAFDGDPAFCALLQPSERGGDFSVELEGQVAHEQQYLDNSAVLRTVLTAADGAQLEILDFAPRYKRNGRLFHPMSLLRRVRRMAGSPRIRLTLRPLMEYGSRVPAQTWGSNHVRFVLGDLVLRATTDAPLPMLRDGLPFLLDRDIHFVLGPDETLDMAPQRFIAEALHSTLDYWHEWVRYLSIPAEWQEAVIRAAITLKLCQYEGTGAIVAALTTSIPEAPDTGRNWDYRFCWLRDAGFVVRALNRLGATRSMEEYLRYVFNLATGDDTLAPVYGIHFERELTERSAAGLAGYRGMGPVRVGNDAWRQHQHDVYGSVLIAAAQSFFDRRLVSPGDAAAFTRLEPIGDRAFALAEEPDAGIWEFRGRREVHTYSAVMCWVACERLARIAEHLALNDRAAHWRTRARQLQARILERGVSAKRGCFVDCYGGDALDASLLLLSELGFISASDPRFIATVDAIGEHLQRDGYLYRYVRADDFGRPENSFMVCNFWYVDALALCGRVEAARERFDDLLKRRTRLGLLAEDLDTHNGEQWGNFPQTYSHVGLIQSAMRLSRRWEDLL